MENDINELKKIVKKIKSNNTVKKNDTLIKKVGGYFKKINEEIIGGSGDTLSQDKLIKLLPIPKVYHSDEETIIKKYKKVRKRLKIKYLIVEEYFIYFKDDKNLTKHNITDFGVLNTNDFKNYNNKYFEKLFKDYDIKIYFENVLNDKIYKKEFNEAKNILFDGDKKKIEDKLKKFNYEQRFIDNYSKLIEEEIQAKYKNMIDIEIDSNNEKFRELVLSKTLKIPQENKLKYINLVQKNLPIKLVSNDNDKILGKIKYSYGDLYRFLNMKNGIIPEGTLSNNVKLNTVLNIMKDGNPKNIAKKIGEYMMYLTINKNNEEKKKVLHDIIKKLALEHINRTEKPYDILKGLDLEDTPLKKYHDIHTVY